jgi:cysteine desulfurase/selenocysteine lyase
MEERISMNPVAMDQPADTGTDAARWRRDFPIFQQTLPKGLPLVYLDSAASAQKPQVVIDKEREVYERYYANAYRGVHRLGAKIDDEMEAARAKVQRWIGAESPDEIIFTAGTTLAINTVAGSWGRKNLRPGDEILLNVMEHHANLVPWQQVAQHTGAKCRFLPLTADGRLDVDVLDQFLTRSTKIVAVTAVSNVLGTVNPIQQLVERAHAVGARVLVDAAQSIPHGKTDVVKWGADFVAFSAHKLFGPSGVGVLYGRRELLQAMDPFVFGGHMISRVTCERSDWADLPAKFEAGTPPIAQAIALGAALDYLDAVNWEAVHAHETRLIQAAFERLTQIPGLRIHGPAAELRSAIVSFSIDGAHPEDLAQLLDRRGVCVRHGHHCTMPLHDWLGVPATVRASFALYNTLAEVDYLVEALHFALQKLRLE